VASGPFEDEEVVDRLEAELIEDEDDVTEPASVFEDSAIDVEVLVLLPNPVEVDDAVVLEVDSASKGDVVVREDSEIFEPDELRDRVRVPVRLRDIELPLAVDETEEVSMSVAAMDVDDNGVEIDELVEVGTANGMSIELLEVDKITESFVEVEI